MVKGKRAEHELTSHSLTLAFHDWGLKVALMLALCTTVFI